MRSINFILSSMASLEHPCGLVEISYATLVRGLVSHSMESGSSAKWNTKYGFGGRVGGDMEGRSQPLSVTFTITFHLHDAIDSPFKSK